MMKKIEYVQILKLPIVHFLFTTIILYSALFPFKIIEKSINVGEEAAMSK